MTRTKWPFFAAMLACAIAFACAYFAMNRERWRFVDRVTIGMSRADVLESVGRPNQILQKGDELPGFGNVMNRIVSQETWVYFVFPGSQHRFVLTIAGDKVVGIEYAAN